MSLLKRDFCSCLFLSPTHSLGCLLMRFKTNLILIQADIYDHVLYNAVFMQSLALLNHNHIITLSTFLYVEQFSQVHCYYEQPPTSSSSATFCKNFLQELTILHRVFSHIKKKKKQVLMFLHTSLH